MAHNIGLEFPATNVYKVWVGDKTILFSYGTAVAAWVRGNGEVKRYQLKKAPTATSAKHLSQHGPKRYLLPDEEPVNEVTEEELDRIIGGTE